MSSILLNAHFAKDRVGCGVDSFPDIRYYQTFRHCMSLISYFDNVCVLGDPQRLAGTAQYQYV